MTVLIGQLSYSLYPSAAVPGQLGDLTSNDIDSAPAAEVINPGRLLQIASDGVSVQQVQNTSGDTTTPPSSVGVAVLKTAREGGGATGVTAYGIGGVTYAVGEMVPFVRKGRIFAEWKGTTQTAFGTPRVYHSSTTATDRGKFTDAAAASTAGSEVSPAGSAFRLRQAFAGAGSVCLLDVNLPGAA